MSDSKFIPPTLTWELISENGSVKESTSPRVEINKIKFGFFLQWKRPNRHERGQKVLYMAQLSSKLHSRQEAFEKMFKTRPVIQRFFFCKSNFWKSFWSVLKRFRHLNQIPFFSLLNLCVIFARNFVFMCVLIKQDYHLINFLYSAYFFFAFCWKYWPENVN